MEGGSAVPPGCTGRSVPRSSSAGLAAGGWSAHPHHWLPAASLLWWEDAAEGEDDHPAIAALSGGSPDPAVGSRHSASRPLSGMAF